ncbi:MAG: hypothetical protein V4467_04740 [Patescibacteria group bacterium]
MSDTNEPPDKHVDPLLVLQILEILLGIPPISDEEIAECMEAAKNLPPEWEAIAQKRMTAEEARYIVTCAHMREEVDSPLGKTLTKKWAEREEAKPQSVYTPAT